MSAYLCQTTEVYHVDTERAAKEAIEEAKTSNQFQLKKYLCEYKEIKAKGEVISDYWKITLVKEFNNIKEPETFVKVKYSTDLFEE